MLQNAPDCTIQKTFSGKNAPKPPSKLEAVVDEYMCKLGNWMIRRKPPPPKKIIAPPLANPAYVHELLLRNLFENPPWQTVDCV